MNSKKYPMVSAVIPSYNRERLLPRAIDSVINQTYKDWELIIVDDRSTDGTEELIREYIKKDKRISYIKNTHKQGPAGARNKGVETANGEYIAFLDSDDEWKDFHLENIIGEFEKNKDVDWIYADNERVKEDTIITKSVFKELWKGKDKHIINKRDELCVLSGKNLASDALRYGLYAGCQGSVMRSKVFNKLKFDESFSYGGVEDRLTPLEAISKGFKLAYIERVHLAYHVHKDSISAGDLSTSIDERLKVLNSLGKLYTEIPCKIPVIKRDKKILKSMLANLYFWDIGYRCYLQDRNYVKAKEYFLKGLRLRPFNLRYWKSYIKNIIFRFTRKK